MREDDLPAVMEIEHLSFTLEWSENAYRYELTNPLAYPMIAEINGKVAGVLVAWLVVDEVQIATIATHPDFRRRGVARALLVYIFDEARQQKMKQAFLEVRRGNLGAQALYQQLGFYQIGVRRRYYQDNHEDAFVLALDL
jgi:[ribosomal protein S18]-alanine N-acetyltransferase